MAELNFKIRHKVELHEKDIIKVELLKTVKIHPTPEETDDSYIVPEEVCTEYRIFYYLQDEIIALYDLDAPDDGLEEMDNIETLIKNDMPDLFPEIGEYKVFDLKEEKGETDFKYAKIEISKLKTK